MPVNKEYLYNASLGDSYDSESFVDVLSHPVDLPIAAAADTFSSLYNLGAAADLYDPISTNDVLETFAHVGLPDARQYFEAHPIATQIGSLLTGGGLSVAVGTKVTNLASRVASKALGNSMKSGKVMFNDSIVEIGKQARLEQAVADKLATDTVYGASFKSALRKANALGGGSIFLDAVVQETVFAGLMSQHTLLEDYGWKDWVIGAGVYGGLNLGFKALSSKLAKTTELTSENVQQQNKLLQEEMTYVPPEFKAKVAEAAILQKDVADLLALESSDAADAGTKTLASRLRLKFQERQLGLISRVLDTTGMSPAMEETARAQLLGMLKEPMQAAGIEHISALSNNKVVITHLQKDLQFGDELIAIKERLLAGDSVKTIAKAFDMSLSDVQSAHTALTHQIFDLENKRFLDLTEVSKLVSGKHREVDGTKLVFMKDLTAGEVHASLKEAAKIGQKLKGVTINTEKAEENILTRTAVWEYLSKHKTGIVNGKKLTEEEFAAVKSQYGAMHLSQGREELKVLEHAGYSVAELERRLNLTGITDLGADTSTLAIRNVGKSWKGSEHRNLLVTRGDLQKTDAIQTAVGTDSRLLNTLADDSVRQIVAASGSALAQDILDTAQTGINVKLKETLDATNQALFSSRALGSAEFALRHQPIQEMANLTGTLRKSTRDAVIKEVDKDLAKRLHIIQLDKSKMVKWNQSELDIRNARAGKGEIVTIRDDKLVILKTEEKGVLLPPEQQTIVQEITTFDHDIAEFWVHHEQQHAAELLRLKNLNRTVQGLNEVRGKGLILSPRNLTTGERAYLVSRTPGLAEKDRTIMLTSQTKEGLQSLIERAQTAHPDYELLTPGINAKRYNLVHDHARLGYMKYAEFGKSQTSVKYTGVATNTAQMEQFLGDVLGEYGRQVSETWRNLHGEVGSKIKNMVDITDGFGDGGNVWNTIYKTMFGGSELADHTVLAGMNNVFVEGAQHVADIVNDSILGVVGRGISKRTSGLVRKGRGKKELGTQTTYEEILKDWELKGFKKEELPWSNAADALLETKAYKAAGKAAESAVAFNNFTTATLALRFLELAHPLINALSIPITAMPEIGVAMKAAGHTNFSAMKLMMEGTARAGYGSAEHAARFERWLEQGITTPHVAEVTKLRQSLAVNPSLISRIDNNRMFEIATKASDLSESMARRISAGTADAVFDVLHAGDKATLTSDVLRDAFVNTFVKRAQGNYATAQRPVLFQGTFGSMIGLFQTYMWTLGQNTYRFLEAGDRARVLQLGALQTGIFGLESLPGYDLANQYIGSHFGNLQHKNITSLLFDQVQSSNDGFNKKVVESIVYGFPGAMLDTALYTRGTLAPRAPISLTAKGGVEANFAAVAPLMTAVGIFNNTMETFGEGSGLGDSFTSAIQLQQLSRPFSRYADFVAGKSIERTGKVVDPNVETPLNPMKWNLATLARVTGARPLQDQVIRNLSWTNSYYNSQSGEERRRVLKSLRLLQQQPSEVGDEETLTKLFERYVNAGGSIMGFRSALNDAEVNNVTGKVVEIKKGSTLEHMQSLYGYSQL